MRSSLQSAQAPKQEMLYQSFSAGKIPDDVLAFDPNGGMKKNFWPEYTPLFDPQNHNSQHHNAEGAQNVTHPTPSTILPADHNAQTDFDTHAASSTARPHLH